MTKLSVERLALVVVGFVVGGACGVASLAGRAPQAVSVATSVPHVAATTARVHDVASSCGAYGLPGSPAVVSLTAGAEGRPVRVSVESDIFGGDELEACVLEGVRGLPMDGDSLRVVLPTFQPADPSDMVAIR